MSCGICKCSVCHREVHQDRDAEGRLFWYHCDTKSRLCEGALATYAKEDGSDLKGEWCGMDSMARLIGVAK